MRMAVLMMVFMAVGMIPVCVRFAHNPFTTLAAAQAAPDPLSIFLIPPPGGQAGSCPLFNTGAGDEAGRGNLWGVRDISEE